jgi:ubiquinone/menaquinone biosynthesis C-methylase UbiE
MSNEHLTTHTDRAVGSGTPSFGRYGGSAAENYERYFVPAIAAPLAADLIEVAALDAGARVLDVACGTGVVARLASQRVGATGSVAGLDVNPGMLAVARSVAAAGAAIEWHQSDAQDIPFADDAYDVALCQLGLQFFADRSAALREVRRVLAPGGRLVANVPGPTPRIFGILEQALRRHVTPEAARFVSTVFSLYDADGLCRLLDDAGFEDISVRAGTKSLQVAPPTEFLWQYVSSTPLAASAAGLNDDRRASLERDVVAQWESFTNDGALILELDIVTATARSK